MKKVIKILQEYKKAELIWISGSATRVKYYKSQPKNEYIIEAISKEKEDKKNKQAIIKELTMAIKMLKSNL